MLTPWYKSVKVNLKFEIGRFGLFVKVIGIPSPGVAFLIREHLLVDDLHHLAS